MEKKKIVLVGSGNVATQMGVALRSVGHEIVQVYSRNIANAQLLADRLNCSATADLSSVAGDAGVYILSVKDDALPALAAALCPDRQQGLFLHTAGSVPLEVFRGLAVHYGVLYPMQTFSKNRRVDFREIPCFIEGSDEETLRHVRELAETLSDSVHVLPSEKRKSLHLAAVFACNFTNHCYRLAERVLGEAGLDFSLYLPLIDETVRKVHDMSPRQAQTGPAVRYDKTVIDSHLAMLKDEKMRDIYALMSRSIHEDKQP